MGAVARFGVIAAALALSCSLIDLSSLGGDASVDAAIDAPADGFVLTSSRSHVTMDKNEGLDVAIGISRGAAFTDVVDVTVGVVGLTNVSVPPSFVFTAGAPQNLHIDVPLTTNAPQDGTITMTGVGRSTLASAPQLVLGVRIGSVLVDTQSNTSTPIPAYATTVTIKAWGAGGGAGASPTINGGNVAAGGFGGGGGMSGGIFPTPSGSTLTIVVGQPGKSAGGGSGGGYSIVSIGTTTLLVAGGGGGGAQGFSDPGYCSTPQPTGNGYAGGGGDAEKSTRSATMSAPGAAGDTSATAGVQYLGGNGSPIDVNGCKFNGCADGGAPGGGTSGHNGSCSASGGGGGGGGYWGGGGGASNLHQGGGGGSGFAGDAGADVIQARGATATPASPTDPDYVAGTATGGSASTDTTAAVLATSGRVVVRLPKP